MCSALNNPDSYIEIFHYTVHQESMLNSLIGKNLQLKESLYRVFNRLEALLSFNDKTEFYNITTYLNDLNLRFKQAQFTLQITNKEFKTLTWTSAEVKFFFDFGVLKKCIAHIPLNEIEFNSLRNNSIFSILTNSGLANYVSIGRTPNAPIREDSALFRIFKLIHLNLNDAYYVSKKYEMCASDYTMWKRLENLPDFSEKVSTHNHTVEVVPSASPVTSSTQLETLASANNDSPVPAKAGKVKSQFFKERLNSLKTKSAGNLRGLYQSSVKGISGNTSDVTVFKR